MAGLPVYLCMDKEIAQVLENKCDIQRLLDLLQVEDLSYLTEKTGVPLEQWKLVQKRIFEQFDCSWKSATELKTSNSPALSLAQIETSSCFLGYRILDHIRSKWIVEVAGKSNCGKSELVYRIALLALAHMPVYLFTTSKKAACARLATLRSLFGQDSSTDRYDRFYVVECFDFYSLCNYLQNWETCLVSEDEADFNSCKALVLIDGMHIAQMLSLDCTYHERMSWIEFFTLLLKRIAVQYGCCVVVTNTVDRLGEPMFAPRWSYCPDVHILFEEDISVKDEEMKFHLTIQSRWHQKETSSMMFLRQSDEINADHF